MRKLCATILLFQSLALPVSGPGLSATPARVESIPISLSQSVIALDGPWKFHNGDDLRWANPNFDDSDWESVDLTPPPGAHDADVGLTGYVPGWTAEGHTGYSGFAWYRIAVSVVAPLAQTLALAGPADVDDAYQLFLNGRMAGGIGDFSGSIPTVYSIQPRTFPLNDTVEPAGANASRNVVIAFRVWMRADSLTGSSGAGGIHIAPALGEASAIEALYRLQWLETFYGYVVDAIEPILFVALAIMACTLISFDPSDRAYPWMGVGLLLTALVRANQPLFFWTQLESLEVAYLARNVVLIPLGLCAWTMAWRSWFRVNRPIWLPKAVLALTLLYMGAELTSFSSLSLAVPHSSAVLHCISSALRLLFLVILTYVAYAGTMKRTYDRSLAVPAAVLISVGLFASELSSLRIPGIWFPYGIGVSRTQFVYAAFDVVLFALLLRRLLHFAQRFRGLSPDSKYAEQA